MDEVTDRLLDAAAEVFAERGYEGAGVAEIARRAGLTTGAIYSRYTGKAQLLAAAIDQRLVDDLQQILDSGAANLTATDIISSLGAGLLDGDDCEDGLIFEAITASRRDPELASMMQRRFEDERLRLRKVIDEAKADGLIDKTLDTRAVVTLCHSVGFGFRLIHSVGLPMPEPEGWTNLIDRLLQVAMPDLNHTSDPLVDGVHE